MYKMKYIIQQMKKYHKKTYIIDVHMSNLNNFIATHKFMRF